MTGTEAFRQALCLLNYTEPRTDGGVPGGEVLYRRALPVLNQIAADLWYLSHAAPFQPLTALHDDIPLPPAVVQGILPYGVAMLLAQLAGDADNQTLMAAQYDQRRSGAATGTRLRDRLPTCRG